MTGHDVLVRHDYTWRDVQTLSTMAARRVNAAAVDFDEMCDVARCALVEMLWGCEQPPGQRDLLMHASDQVRAWVRRDKSAHGVTKWNTASPRFAGYWIDYHDTDPVTDRMDERLALAQVFDRLDERDQHILWTRAMFDTGRDAAQALGMWETVFSKALRAARRRALRLWFDVETPPSWEGKRDRRAHSSGATRQMVARRRIARGSGRRSS